MKDELTLTDVLKMTAMRFVRGFLAGAIGAMVLVNAAGINTFADLTTFFAGLAVSLIVGGITGGLLAADKFLRSLSE